MLALVGLIVTLSARRWIAGPRAPAPAPAESTPA